MMARIVSLFLLAAVAAAEAGAPAPGNLQATADGSWLILTWTAPKGYGDPDPNDGIFYDVVYEVLRYSHGKAKKSLMRNEQLGELFTDTTVVSGQTYIYAVSVNEEHARQTWIKVTIP